MGADYNFSSLALALDFHAQPLAVLDFRGYGRIELGDAAVVNSVSRAFGRSQAVNGDLRAVLKLHKCVAKF